MADPKRIAKDLYVDYFSKQEWDDRLQTPLSFWKETGTAKERDTTVQVVHGNAKLKDLSVLRGELEKLKVEDDDDWENCYSD